MKCITSVGCQKSKTIINTLAFRCLIPAIEQTLCHFFPLLWCAESDPAVDFKPKEWVAVIAPPSYMDQSNGPPSFTSINS